MTQRSLRNNVEESKQPSKEFAVSFLSSNKNFCAGHKFRMEIFERIPDSIGSLKVIKHKSPPRIDKVAFIDRCQFSIAPENSVHKGYFTEKIVDCFLHRVVPLYWGCSNIGKFFDAGGILLYTSYEELEVALKNLTPTTYMKMTKFVEKNYYEALKYSDTLARVEALIDECLGHTNGERKFKPVIYKSNSMTDASGFANKLKDRSVRISITIDDGFNFKDEADLRIYLQLEPQEVMGHIHRTEFPQVKQTVKQQIIENQGWYDKIFTWDEEILSQCENSKFFPHGVMTLD